MDTISSGGLSVFSSAHLSPLTNFSWVFLSKTGFLCYRSILAVHGPERDIGGLQGTSASAMLLSSGAQRAVSGQVHQDAIAAAVPAATRPVPPAPTRGRLQPGCTSGRPRRAADERDHRENNRWVLRSVLMTEPLYVLIDVQSCKKAHIIIKPKRSTLRSES